jgi:alpha-beta hydrolase superfamily lysophospholipase
MVENQLIESREVSWKVEGITVYGTLTTPANGKASCGVVFVAGSGPTDRDWCSPLLPGTNGSGKLLAELLAQKGFVTLRYDKVASGPRVRENMPKLIGKMSMKSHLDELSGAVQTLISEGHIGEDCFFVLTNSEGAIHALNYQLQAKRRRFRGLVFTGAPGRAIGAVARSQILAQLQALPNALDLIKKYDEAVAAFAVGKPMVVDGSLPEGIRMLLLSLATPANLPFARELWRYDAAEFIAKVDEPILVVIGKKDMQTDWQADGAALEKATAKKTNITYVYPENANHVLKHDETPREQLNAQATLRYNASDTELDQQTADIIIKWIKQQKNFS